MGFYQPDDKTDKRVIKTKKVEYYIPPFLFVVAGYKIIPGLNLHLFLVQHR